jgi:RNA polymerase sigma factor (sigma-70 family)
MGMALAIDRLTDAVTDHEPWLRSVIAARLHHRDAVDEVMQEVAVAAAKSQQPPTDRSAFAPWLYRVAIRQVLLYRRNHARRSRLMARYASDRGAVIERSGDAADPLGWLLRCERESLVRDAICLLPDRDRQLLLLKYANSFSYEQIANHLGCSVSAVESRLHRARASLRKHLHSAAHPS